MDDKSKDKFFRIKEVNDIYLIIEMEWMIHVKRGNGVDFIPIRYCIKFVWHTAHLKK